MAAKEVRFAVDARDKMLRGQLVEVSIEDGVAAQDDVLFVGGKPMLF